MERIYPKRSEIENILVKKRLENHVERYQLVKRYCFGHVLDIACGVGYGSYLLQNNPDIESVTGVDINSESIDFANENYRSKKVSFEIGNILNYKTEHDVLISLETIEHIDSLEIFNRMVERVDPALCIVSFPNKKSTHFNKYHKHDLTIQQVVSTLNRFVLVKRIYQHDVTILVMSKKDQRMPNDLFSEII